jgi:hypothetical protein
MGQPVVMVVVGSGMILRLFMRGIGSVMRKKFSVLVMDFIYLTWRYEKIDIGN